MQKLLTKPPLVIRLGAVALVAAGTISASSMPASAQDNKSASSMMQREQAIELVEVMGHGPGMGGPMGYGYISEEELLANALGITAAELTEAYDKAFELSIEQAVTDGELTQAQADEMLAEPTEEEMHHGFEGEMILIEPAFMFGDVERFLPQTLGLSPEEFDTAVDGAIQKAANDGLITQAQANEMLLDKLIEEKLDQAYDAALDEAVAQDLITQVQADRMREDADAIAIAPLGDSCHFIQSWGGPGFEEDFFIQPWGEFGLHMDEFEFFIEPGMGPGRSFRMP